MEIINRNELAKKYSPLVNKIAGQFTKSSGYSFDDCVSAGNIGLVYAMDNYKENEGKKKQTFTQYAAYMIRFFILNDINQNAHTIRVNQQQQKRLKEEGMSINLTSSLDRTPRGKKDEDKGSYHDITPGASESDVYIDIDPGEDEIWRKVFAKLNQEFTERDLDIFYSTFGINGHKELKGKDMAEKYGISAGSITQIRNKVISYMKKNKRMMEALVDIMQINNRENYAL